VKRVLTAVILIPLVVLALFRAPLWLFTLLVLGVALLAAKEYFDIAEKTGHKPARFLGYLFLLLLFLLVGCLLGTADIDNRRTFDTGDTVVAVLLWGVPLFALITPLLLLLQSLDREPLSKSLADAAVSYLVLPYVGFTLILLPTLSVTWNGPLYLLYLMLLVWCGDIAAYYVGRAIGKHKLAPRISPGKTWEGAIASVIGAVIVGTLLFHFINPIAAAFRNLHLLASPTVKFGPPIPNLSPTLPLAPIWFVTVFAICVNVAAQLGDLVESALKRGAGMKDSGTLLPGHGGVLDRIDALLFALPVGLLFYAFGMSRYFELRGIQ
jgi:phosphatidate cytidylyltransferase